MQTFLPFENFYRTANILDSKRLNKQIVEVYQIFAANHYKGGWKNHPAVLMWKGYDIALFNYLYNLHQVYRLRGRKEYHQSWLNFIKMYFDIYHRDPFDDMLYTQYKFPEWLGDERFHSSHRSNLLRKDPEYYGQFEWTEGPDLPYFWPTKEGY